jgi:hypothetical protein
MNEVTTLAYPGASPSPASKEVCQDCPAFDAHVAGGLVTGKVYAYCRVTGARVSPMRIQCNLTDEQKAICRRAPTTSSR